MKSTIISWLLILQGVYFYTAESAATKVSIYYSSLCPEALAFIVNQFTPTFRLFGPDAIMPDFLPYGKSVHTQTPEGEWNLFCQHGTDECDGNAHQACALEYITDPRDRVEFIHCVMADDYPPFAGAKCADSLGLDYTSVQACIDSPEGYELVAVIYGNRTLSIDSEHRSFMPLVIYDDKFNQEDQDESQRNFFTVVCRHLSPRPAECP